MSAWQEALPDDAVPTGRYIMNGQCEVWETERWQYAVRVGTRDVVNVTKRCG